MRRTLSIAVALLVAGLAAAPSATASRKPWGGARTIAIQSHFDDQGGLITPHSCSTDTPGLCQFTFSSKPTWSGTFTGTSINHSYGTFNPLTQEVHGEIWEYFPEVTVDGCGTGTMVWRGEIVMKPGEQDPTRGGIVMQGTWEYVKGSGTGGLANIESGTFTMKDGVFKPPFMENHEDAVGSLVCGSGAGR